MNYLWLIFAPLLFSGLTPAFAQEIIIVNQTAPCFLNQTAGLDLWQNCNADGDWLTFALLPFEWITGGWFSALLVSIFILMIYLKYHQMVYVIIIGIIFLPISFQFFPQVFLGVAMIMIVLSIAGYIFYMLKRQTD